MADNNIANATTRFFHSPEVQSTKWPDGNNANSVTLDHYSNDLNELSGRSRTDNEWGVKLMSKPLAQTNASANLRLPVISE